MERPAWRRRAGKRALVLGLAGILVAAAILGAAKARGTRDRVKSGVAVLRSGGEQPPGIYVSGGHISGPGSRNRRLHGKSEQLAGPATAPLLGGEEPVASLSADGETAAYNTWAWTRDIDWFHDPAAQGVKSGDVLATPVVHVLDLASGADRALEPGTLSPTWRADGALAYARGDVPEYRWNVPYLRDVVVRATPADAPVVWTDAPASYRVDGWAGSRLLVTDDPDVLVFDGPRKSRVLAQGADLLAISPDGETALVSQTPSSWPRPELHLVRIADGVTVAALPLASIVDPLTGAGVAWVAGPAEWRGDEVLASTETGLVVLRTTASAIGIEQVLHLDQATKPNGMLFEPRFAEDSTSTIVAWADVSTPRGKPWQSAQIVCDRVSLVCDELAAVPAKDVTRPVYTRTGGHP